MRKLRVSLLLLLFAAQGARAQGPPDSILAEVGVEQKLNAPVPLDLTFKDERGDDVKLGELFHNKPVVLSLV